MSAPATPMGAPGGSSSDYRLEPHWPQIPEGIDHRDASGIATDAAGNVYVLARTEPAHQVLVYAADGAYLNRWGAGTIRSGHGISIVDDLAYITDVDDHTVRRYSLDGELQLTIGTPGTPSASHFDPTASNKLLTIRAGAGPFNRPAMADVAANGDIFVADGYGNAQVHRFDADGALIQSWGRPGSAPGEFHLPHSLCVHRDTIMVADRENYRIQVFSHSGELLDIWDDVRRPSDLCVDSQGRVFVSELALRADRVSDSGRPMVETYPSVVTIRDDTGQVMGRIGGGDDPLAPGNFISAHGMCLGPDDSLYVAEVTATALSPRLRSVAGIDYEDGMRTVQKFTSHPRESSSNQPGEFS